MKCKIAVASLMLMLGCNTIPTVIPQPKWDYKITELRSWAEPLKLKTADEVPRGIVAAIYNNTSRKNSEIWELDKAGNWKKIYSGAEETIGEPLVGASIHAGRLYYSAERGERTIWYDLQSGSIGHGGGTDNRWKWRVENVVWRGRPVMGGDGDNVQAAIFDCETGAKIVDSPLDGLISGMTVDDEGHLWLAVAGKGIAQIKKDLSAGQVLQCNAASVAYMPGLGICYGSQVDGKVYQKDGSSWNKIADLGGSKVNNLRADTRNSTHHVLVASVSNPDKFVAIHPNGDTETIWYPEPHEAVVVNGEQFGCYITLYGDDGYLLCRYVRGQKTTLAKATKK